jgi:hypothetical protein
MGSKFLVKIKCPLHGIFLQEPRMHLQGCECRQCGFDKTHNFNRITHEEWIYRSNIMHCNKYDYSLVSHVNIPKVIIICQKHGEFLQGIRDHLKGRGCPKCKTSKGENTIREWLETHNIQYNFQQTFNDCKNPRTNYKLRFDFYVPSKNLLIEFDGQQHYQEMNTGKYIITQKRLEDSKYRDNIKTLYASNKNIKLLRISYKEFNKIDSILSNSL